MTADVDPTAPIHAALAAKGLLPGDHLLDAGYVDVELLVGSRFEHGVRIVGPVRPDVSWKARANQGFDIAHFTSDREARKVTCPEGKTSTLWTPGHDRWGNAVIHTEFHAVVHPHHSSNSTLAAVSFSGVTLDDQPAALRPGPRLRGAGDAHDGPAGPAARRFGLPAV